MSLAPGTNLGPYRILALLGQGGMGEVYRAEDPKLGREVALKVLPEAFAEDRERLARFEREARVTSALDHPNILAIHELGESGGRPFLVMELLEGHTLQTLMREGPMAPERVARLGEQVAAGLAAAHERGLVHRDLKPANIFVTRDRVVKILDFGLAKQQAPDPGGSECDTVGETAAGLVMGTAAYMSPEQACGRPVDFRSDQFSLGVVLYELLNGRRPFQGRSAAETLASIVRDDPSPLPRPADGVSVPLAGIVRRCLAKAPEDRYPSTLDLMRDLGSLAVRRRGEQVRGRGGAWRLLAGGLVACGVVLGGVAIWGRWRAPAGRPGRAEVSLVTLPAQVLGSPDSAFLGEAVPDTLSTLLAGTRGLVVRTPPTAKALADHGGDLRAVSRAYGVDHLVTSTVALQGETLILNLRLVDAAGQGVTWAGQFQGVRADYNALLHQAAGALAKHLQLEQGAAGRVDAVRSEVELALGEGRYFQRCYGEENRLDYFTQGSSAYTRALELEPRNASALAGLGGIWRVRFIHTGEPAALPQAESWARQALKADPGSAEAWYTLAWIAADRHGLEETLMYSLRAAHLSPGTARYQVSVAAALDDPGTCRLHLAALEEAQRVEPLGAENGTMFLANLLVRLHRPEEALRILDRRLALRPNDFHLQLIRARALATLGRVPEAEVLLAQGRKRAFVGPPWNGEYWRQLRLLCELKRLPREAARTRARVFVGQYRASPPDQYSLVLGPEILAPRLIQLDLGREALDLLELKTESGGPPNLDWLYEDPDLRRLHGDPRFTRVLLEAKRMGVRHLDCLDRARSQGELPAYLEPAVKDLRRLVGLPVPGGS